MRKLCPALLAVAFAACGTSGTPPTPRQSDDGAARRIEADVRFLADDLLEGREAGTRGYDLAAHYVAERMRAIGLEPAGTDGGWLQPVRMLRGVREREGARFAVAHAGKVTELAFEDDFLPGTSFTNPRVAITAPLVFVGYGVQAPELGHDDFAGLEVKGRIAVVVQGAPPTFPNDQRAYHSSSSRKSRVLVAQGAVGMVTLRPPEDEERRPWRVDAGNWQRAGMRLLDAGDRPVDDFPELVGRAGVRTGAAAALFEGATQSLEQVWQARGAGTMPGFALAATATLEGNTAVAPVASDNVVGLLRGSDEALAAEHLVFSAHLDHLGTGAAVDGDALYNGAIDNALGIAAMLEAATALAASPPRRSVLFVATTAEEKGLLGAQRFAREPTVPADSIVANINIDMPVLNSPGSAYIGWGAEHTTLGPQLTDAARALGLVVAPDPFPEEVVFVRSDQFRFIEQGVPAIYLGTTAAPGDAAGKQATEQFLKQRYHLPSDDLSQPIEWQGAAQLARLSELVARAAGDADARPAWNAGDFFGETFGKKPAR
jgi:Zn-dependent M28 family amino/carboxypeptidase